MWQTKLPSSRLISTALVISPCSLSSQSAWCHYLLPMRTRVQGAGLIGRQAHTQTCRHRHRQTKGKTKYGSMRRRRLNVVTSEAASASAADIDSAAADCWLGIRCSLRETYRQRYISSFNLLWRWRLASEQAWTIWPVLMSPRRKRCLCRTP